MNWKELASLFRITKPSEKFSDNEIISKADLHMHTTASDGFFSPSEVVKKSFDAGLRIISITDHDSIDGLKEAKEYAKNLNIDVINGIELSAEFEDKEVHILGYFFDETNSEFTLKIDEFKNQRYQRIINFVEKLNQKQISISIDDVLEFSKTGTLGRPH
ncbi:MAG TPA: PHP domain-containing protein, partial [Ignavibacteriaceae bacterium]|nr:PHP domain-containing protein [Ignavibacteriaceae bacterium]